MQASLYCYSGDSSTPSQPFVTVEVGALLAPYLDHRGVRVTVMPAAGNTSLPLPPHWGISIKNVTHLTLFNSSLENIPLSPGGPLFECWECAEVTVKNLTLRGLGPPAVDLLLWGGRYNVHGAVQFTGAQSIILSSFACSDVQGAHGFACLLVDFKLSIRDGVMENNTVVPATASYATSSEPLRRLLNGRLQGTGALAIIGNSPSSSQLNLEVQDCRLNGNNGGSGAAIFSSMQMTDAGLILLFTHAPRL
ncbi:hypothetical protein TSOC_011897 [Tetrabaena socialis]|uniref:Uncharacterized protein n=1 Tax=Tetrabaena socialis TaxID=47790 RepID=A0A2J7ZPE7_9CHLO|nr:hypothetical protein TSOC_011897 [Tetrabaena socialis]|eukprot:PNH02139.1 hypothetical protein TSOC_011897 [Tetrabaena socialis]